MSEIWKWTTSETATRVASGEVGAREVTEAHLDRIDAVNPTLNAVTNDVRESALARANELDASFAADGTVGPLHGVPVTIKENIDVEGQVTPNGLTALADLVAPGDSPLVTNMKRAGAVIIGRTNTPELSYRWHTDNPLRGQTHNPWSANRTPGGSSGGAAASLAAGIGTIAHGNDLGGSIRQPANCCGLVGLRPSLGRIAAHNPSSGEVERSLALQLMSVQGPLGRTVDDVRRGFDVMAEPSHADPWYRPGPAYAESAPCRVAVTYGIGEIDAEVTQAVDAAAAHLAEAGYEVEFVDPPDIDGVRNGWRSILTTESATSPITNIPGVSEALTTAVGWMFDGHGLDVAGLVAAYTQRQLHLKQWMNFLAERPIIIAPVSQRVPFAPGDDAADKDTFFRIVDGHACLVAVNYLGLPGLAVPTAMTDDGPVGVQLIGSPFDEYRLLDAGTAIEQRVGVMTEHLWAGDGRI